MGDSTVPWRDTTHDWASVVDAEHLAEVRRAPRAFASGGILHLILEVVAYASDEAETSTSGRCVVTFSADGSVSVTDDGRGTDIRFDAHGQPIKKPVMATKDLRFFDFPDAQALPDGHPRRGISVVAALSEWLIHTNRRRDGAWAQRYRHGLPVTGLVPIDDDGTSGTTVRFRPEEPLCGPAALTAAQVRQLTDWPHLLVEVIDERDS